jgi:glycosyltransferase involved in cell wall biosynthesis
MHVHSLHSRSSGYWFFRALQSPESYTRPEHVYEKSRERGMDFVTITDINSIDGVMRIIDLPGVFTGEEIRTHLHGSRKTVHILAYGFDPGLQDEILRLRECFEDLAELFSDKGVPFALAHPFHADGPGLEKTEFEAVVRRCPMVETLNGSRLREENGLVEEIVRQARQEPGFSAFVGGSDDRCGRFAGHTFTTVPGAATPREFLDGALSGRGVPGGLHGTALKLAYSTYSIAYSHYRDSLQRTRLPLFATATADRMFADAPAPPTLWEKADLALHEVYHKTLQSGDQGPESLLLSELILIGKDLYAGGRGEGGVEISEKTYSLFSRTTNRLLDRFAGLLLRRLESSRFLEAVEALSALIPVVLLNAPYPVSFYNLSRGRRSALSMAGEFPGCPVPAGTGARAWFTDTIDDLNGVSRTLQKFCQLAAETGRKLAVVACQNRPLSFEGWVVNFPPVREFPVPDYESKSLSIPPFLDLLRFVEENRFEVIYISTPGPVGLAALGIAKLLGIPTVGIYHTDFPRHVKQILDDGSASSAAASLMAWFYAANDIVMVPSRFYMKELERMGVSSSKMRIFPRGIDLDAFSPEWRDESFLSRFGGSPDSVKLLYVGRVSREKDLEILADAFLYARGSMPALELFVAGDGPYLSELSRRISGRGGYFCGILKGEDLSRAYASADVFVFPSTTDTFGNVVLEAHAAGLPAIVTDRGGPMEIIEPGRTGLVTRGRDARDLSRAILELAGDRGMRRGMAAAARALAETRTWQKAFELVWDSV